MSTPEGYSKQGTPKRRKGPLGAPLRMCHCCWNRMEVYQTHDICDNCLNERRHIEIILREIREAFPVTLNMPMYKIFERLWKFRKGKM